MPTIDINPTGVRAARLPAMTTFVAVVETGGFASAAHKLDLSPPMSICAAVETSDAGQASKGTQTINASVMFGQLYVTPRLECCLQQWPLLDADCLCLDRVVSSLDETEVLAMLTGVLPDSSTWW
jgi:DNA-binding transcriptional LysR family regulator